MSQISERRAVMRGLKPHPASKYGFQVGMITTFALSPDSMPVEDRERVRKVALLEPQIQADIVDIQQNASILRDPNNFGNV